LYDQTLFLEETKNTDSALVEANEEWTIDNSYSTEYGTSMVLFWYDTAMPTCTDGTLLL
jgi:hypothetical protein